MEYKEGGLYIISDDFFSRFPDHHLYFNKSESRPCCYAIRSNGLFWMIPLTSKISTIQARIDKEEAKRGKGSCIFYHIGIVSGRQSGFNIGNMFPVSEKYILRSYEVNGLPYVIDNSHLTKELSQKARKFLSLARSGTIRPQADILAIETSLLTDLQGDFPDTP